MRLGLYSIAGNVTQHHLGYKLDWCQLGLHLPLHAVSVVLDRLCICLPVSRYALVGRAQRHMVVVLCLYVCVSAENFPQLVLRIRWEATCYHGNAYMQTSPGLNLSVYIYSVYTVQQMHCLLQPALT